MLTLRLEALSSELVRGIYTISGVKDRMPARALFLHPDAAASFKWFAPHRVVVSDIFRSPESSLAAVRAGRGALAPGYSAHNYGLAIDLDVPATTKAAGATSKMDLDAWMESHGWYCHRRDHLVKSEGWHYNYLGPKAVIDARATSTASAIESRIQELYGGELIGLTPKTIQTYLAKLRMYSGAIDGLIGPISREALRVFQRAWALSDTGRFDTRTQRTLALVACEKEIVQ